MPAKGTLFLLPVPISEESGARSIPAYNIETVNRLSYFIGEDAKQARRFLKICGYPDISKAVISILNEHTEAGDHSPLIEPLLKGHDLGLMSDAGCPGIADPGSAVVELCHKKNIHVVPLTGPSSIVLSIMASGFDGQNFAFNGYLPVDKAQRARRLKELEQLASKTRQAQFFIETPYRNNQMGETLLATLLPDTLLFIGKDLDTASAFVKSLPVGKWKTNGLPDMHKVPAVFGIFR
jgi:16S rRNA (cytidine1402-2'-O)-methyltransferase